MFLVLFAASIDVTMASIRGVGIYESSTYEGAAVSYAGGANLFFAGSGMNDDPSSNSVKFRTAELSSTEVSLPGTALSCKQ